MPLDMVITIPKDRRALGPNSSSECLTLSSICVHVFRRGDHNASVWLSTISTVGWPRQFRGSGLGPTFLSPLIPKVAHVFGGIGKLGCSASRWMPHASHELCEKRESRASVDPLRALK